MTLEQKLNAALDCWDSSCFDAYLDSANKLLELGMEESEVVDFLENLYIATGREYGA